MDYMLELQKPFKEDEIEWRISRAGKKNGKIWATVLAYIQNRAIQNRLDDIFTPFNWRNEYKEWRNESQLCGISIYDEEKKEWITKWDGAEDTDFESIKGGLSDSMKRAGVQWGIGRYLYNLTENFAIVLDQKETGARYGKLSDKDGGDHFYWKPPSLPDWAISETKSEPENKIRSENKSTFDYEKYFSDCKDETQIKLKYNELDSKYKGKNSIAYKEAEARRNFLLSQK